MIEMKRRIVHGYCGGNGLFQHPQAITLKTCSCAKRTADGSSFHRTPCPQLLGTQALVAPRAHPLLDTRTSASLSFTGRAASGARDRAEFRRAGKRRRQNRRTLECRPASGTFLGPTLEGPAVLARGFASFVFVALRGEDVFLSLGGGDLAALAGFERRGRSQDALLRLGQHLRFTLAKAEGLVDVNFRDAGLYGGAGRGTRAEIRGPNVAAHPGRYFKQLGQAEVPGPAVGLGVPYAVNDFAMSELGKFFPPPLGCFDGLVCALFLEFFEGTG